ncbi:hypothetical protein [Streptomyces fructofermentans]|uniref:Uncharacterized protein n=1 Tax=Streptomyces fructofermentans TaxID=152141 RepID=A0A918NNE4_9ACTN|nr:hypothetical protein [Streptomyces fructofermentans]GGX83108.1 hypothetical protein GCM10010515_58520 [Streptomyces fructofermentans]
MHDAPIYAQLISERGDIPMLVRSEAHRLQRDFEWILSWDPSTGGPLPSSAARLAAGHGSPLASGTEPDQRLDRLDHPPEPSRTPARRRRALPGTG